MKPQHNSMYNRQSAIAPGERIIAALSYVTAGIVGFLWLIISHVSGSRIRNFLRFHIYQSIFLSILFYVFSLILTILLGVVVKIPFIGSLIYAIYVCFFYKRLIFGYSIVDSLMFAIISYLVLFSLIGKLGKLPWVSKVVKGML